LAFSRTSDIELDISDPSAKQLAALRQIDNVDGTAVMNVYALTPRGRPSLTNAASVDGRIGVDQDRPRILKGRAANPNAVDETTIGESLAAQEHIGLDDYIEAESLAPYQLAQVQRGEQPGAPAGPPVRLRVVGIVRRPLDLGDLGASGGVVLETPAFNRAYTGKIASFVTVVRVRTKHHAADVKPVTKAVAAIFGKQLQNSTDLSAESRGGQDAINVLTDALWAFAGVAALAGAVALSIVLSRDLSRAGPNQTTLAALGLTRRERATAVALRAGVIAIAGAILAVLLAIAASPMFPIGIARRAEPAPGTRVDAALLLLGAVALIAFVVVIGWLAATRTTRASTLQSASVTRHRRRTLAEVGARAGMRPSVTNGFRMALEPGRGANALPVRSALLGAVLGLVGVSAALVFAASLGHLQSTPHVYGWSWNFKAPDDTFSEHCDARDFGLTRIEGVTDVAGVCFTSVPIDGRGTTGWGFTPVRGSIDPTVVRGRAARTRSEVALGAATLRALGKHVGDSVEVGSPHGPIKYEIVGQIVLPQLSSGDIQPLSDGAAFTGAGFAPLVDPHTGTTRYLLGRIARGADRAAVERRINAIGAFRPAANAVAFVQDAGVAGPTRPPEVDRVGHIGWFSPILALLIGVLALVAVGHALVTTAHRRRSELALLKTLGFRRGQVRATLAWQATTLAAAGVVVGIPIGILVGNLVWRRVAENIGISPAATVPVLAIAFVIPCAVLVVNVIALWPARTAAHTWPAVALATE
jgi:ABC-type antimicrobial peptide transport system permease subunit